MQVGFHGRGHGVEPMDRTQMELQGALRQHILDAQGNEHDSQVNGAFHFAKNLGRSIRRMRKTSTITRLP